MLPTISRINKIQLWLCIAMFFFPIHAFAADFSSADTAYSRGDFNIAFTEMLTLAKKGFVRAQNNVGSMYQFGRGAEQDYKQAAYWFDKAAKQGFAIAQYNLASLYYSGYGLKQNYSKAAKWFTKAAYQGDLEAQYNLGIAYLYGQGVPKNYKKAAGWFQKAARYGLISAQMALFKMYAKGIGMPKDDTLAYQWLFAAAMQGDNLAKQGVVIGGKLLNPQQIAKAKNEAKKFLHNPGDSNTRWAQVILLRLGYYPGIIDGKKGRKTTLAVKKFQKDIGSFQDGRITKRVMDELEKQLIQK